MSRRDLVLEQVDHEELLFADGYDEAILGVVYRNGAHIVVYDMIEVIKILEATGMDPTEAAEFFEHNIACAYVGAQTPLFLEIINDA